MSKEKQDEWIAEGIRRYIQLRNEADAIEAKAKRERFPLLEQMERIESALSEVINSGANLTSVSTEEGTAYTRTFSRYKLEDRAAFVDTIVSVLPATTSKKAQNMIRKMLGAFGATLSKEFFDEWRLENGGTLKNNKIEGGDLPDGVEFNISEKLVIQRKNND